MSLGKDAIEINVTNGQNIIRLLYDTFASCLVIKQALAVNWPDCAGSIGEYYAISDYSSPERKKLTAQINEVLISGDDNAIADAVKIFLNLFSNGIYTVRFATVQLSKSNFLHEGQVVYSESVPSNQRFSGAFYPHSSEQENFFFTIPHSSIQENQVAHYINLIQSGKRPKAMVFGLYNTSEDEYTASYVLDGHHKIKAYQELGVDIPIVHIIKSEQIIGQTQDMLHCASAILKDFEFQHFLMENEENLEKIDFFSDPFLTSKLDEILSKESKPGIGIVKLFMKLDRSEEPHKLHWLKERLRVLSGNESMGKGLVLMYWGFSESVRDYCWVFQEILNVHDFNSWINKTLPKNGFIA